VAVEDDIQKGEPEPEQKPTDVPMPPETGDGTESGDAPPQHDDEAQPDVSIEPELFSEPQAEHPEEPNIVQDDSVADDDVVARLLEENPPPSLDEMEAMEPEAAGEFTDDLNDASEPYPEEPIPPPRLLEDDAQYVVFNQEFAGEIPYNTPANTWVNVPLAPAGNGNMAYYGDASQTGEIVQFTGIVVGFAGLINFYNTAISDGMKVTMRVKNHTSGLSGLALGPFTLTSSVLTWGAGGVRGGTLAFTTGDVLGLEVSLDTQCQYTQSFHAPVSFMVIKTGGG